MHVAVEVLAEIAKTSNNSEAPESRVWRTLLCLLKTSDGIYELCLELCWLHHDSQHVNATIVKRKFRNSEQNMLILNIAIG